MGRNLYHFPDSNGFVSMFIVDALLEAKELGAITIDSELEKELEQAVEAILTHC